MANTSPLGFTLTENDEPVVRRITTHDLREALSRGYADFMATPTQIAFLGIIYPLVGWIAARAAAGGELLPLFYPLIAGLSLMGPLAAVGIYELSRRREQGKPVSWLNAFAVLLSPSLRSIVTLGLLLCVIFVAWLFAASLTFRLTMGDRTFGSVGEFAQAVLTTADGWNLILLGNAVGFLFAALVLALTVVSFPLLLDHDVGVRVAVCTSLKAVMLNPVPMAIWGLIVASLLLVGSLPLFVGLAVVMPLLGHATWHLYRRVVQV